MIFNKDCIEVLDQLPDQFIQSIVSSPPYNIGKQYEKVQSLADYFDFYREVIGKFPRILKDTGSVFWQTGNWIKNGEIIPLDMLFHDVFVHYGFKLRNRIIWHFEHGLHAKNRFSGRYETILFYTKTNDYVFNLDSVRVPSKYPNKKYYKGPRKGELSGNPAGKNPGDLWTVIENDWESSVWNIPNVKHNHPEKTVHPCQFPVELVERCILVSTNEDDVVFDPFCGAGSAVLAALKNNRKGFGCDIEESYCALAKERIELFKQGKLKFRPIDRKIFEPKTRES